MDKDMNTNASASAYGWCFQVGAGIVLMLDNIKKFISIKMEGKLDDIEIELPNGKIYAQAKSVIQIDSKNNISKKLNDALNILNNDNKNGDVIQLIYITNISNPFSSKTKSVFVYGHSYEYSILSVKEKKKIDKIVDINFPKKKFKVQLLNFFGEDMNKFDSVKDKITEFLRTAINDISYANIVLDNLISRFMVNCSDIPDIDKKCTLTKKEIVFSIIVVITDRSINEDDFLKVSDYENFSDLKAKYNNYLESKICSYEYIVGIIGDYQSSKSQDGKRVSKYEFINKEWEKYKNDFSCINDSKEREAIVKYLLLSIITNKEKINRMKEAANL